MLKCQRQWESVLARLEKAAEEDEIKNMVKEKSLKDRSCKIKFQILAVTFKMLSAIASLLSWGEKGITTSKGNKECNKERN